MSSTDSGDHEGVPAIKCSSRFIVGLVDPHVTQVGRFMAVLTMRADTGRWLMGRSAGIDALFTSEDRRRENLPPMSCGQKEQAIW